VRRGGVRAVDNFTATSPNIPVGGGYVNASIDTDNDTVTIGYHHGSICAEATFNQVHLDNIDLAKDFDVGNHVTVDMHGGWNHDNGWNAGVTVTMHN
jgi:hypothetical protein